MKPRVAINGFGRIGRAFLRANLMADLVEIVAINDTSPNKELAYLLKNDSIYGPCKVDVEAVGETAIKIDGIEIPTYSDRNPENLPWGTLNVDIVIESTGVFRDREGSEKHIRAGAKRVIVSAPGKDLDRTIVLGVNEGSLNKETDKMISNASCTTNCLAPIVKVLNDKFGIVKGLMTTIHSYTNDQNLMDNSHPDLRRARAATLNMIPTSTGAAKAIGEVIPDLQGKLNGLSVRVPTPTVSLVDLVCEVKAQVTANDVNAALREASENGMRGIMGFCEEPLVSSDFIKDNRSSIIDAESTMVIEGNMVKVLAWYDNEWGYSVRLVELAAYMTR
ncbi:type I glyceraldehyde-3-phosphate dehydrogenase [Candidatus Peregrinibacteria bacterium CG22_combo_CG10-13_8_21_14_all_44_10]|nr:MAG: type I glyceraldehyde-3-phosphate dehydrogenase [Candidatus Peregrinibacteria bacterium CG2_30_44_17]PIP65821.1 MAG: type I glyceraldehyde-3-phosphate dehydrogenase [Candidatus Peregrinibacteria bacterium CG22_combo_CG10-13_8_21_14_all_44_10]PIS04172.1 MAG: type I glyceraldehyde-3-phosphate dehydrogenase [Candidatus Peregrinibacteria bacterium CG10_big_fil_rev_8_21_14_0_10_44_7]PIX80565.1 MAG: type I glyceraldehyde-3-phosphate dehydrogenase [Candidatus Peregrinibacteria bacterium CG_4_10